jgi:hypothetical protein
MHCNFFAANQGDAATFAFKSAEKPGFSAVLQRFRGHISTVNIHSYHAVMDD